MFNCGTLHKNQAIKTLKVPITGGWKLYTIVTQPHKEQNHVICRKVEWEITLIIRQTQQGTFCGCDETP